MCNERTEIPVFVPPPRFPNYCDPEFEAFFDLVEPHILENIYDGYSDREIWARMFGFYLPLHGSAHGYENAKRWVRVYKGEFQKLIDRARAGREESRKMAQADVAQRNAELHVMPYDEYLQTPEWLLARREKLRQAHNRCQVCNTADGPLNVHHRTYERRGYELTEDTVVLCQPCHYTFHANRKIDRRKATAPPKKPRRKKKGETLASNG